MYVKGVFGRHNGRAAASNLHEAHDIYSVIHQPRQKNFYVDGRNGNNKKVLDAGEWLVVIALKYPLLLIHNLSIIAQKQQKAPCSVLFQKIYCISLLYFNQKYNTRTTTMSAQFKPLTVKREVCTGVLLSASPAFFFHVGVVLGLCLGIQIGKTAGYMGLNRSTYLSCYFGLMLGSQIGTLMRGNRRQGNFSGNVVKEASLSFLLACSLGACAKMTWPPCHRSGKPWSCWDPIIEPPQ